MNEQNFGTTVDSLPALSADEERLVLAVIGDGSVSSHALPEKGQLSIGRQDTNDICIDDPMVSRHHAVLHMGEGLELEDLGGMNGTIVSGALLRGGERMPIAPGQLIEIASTMLVVQRQVRKHRARRLWPYGYFEMRLEEECDSERHSSFAVVRVVTPPGVARETVEGALASVVEPSDVVSQYAEGQYELLLVRASERRAAEVTSGIASRLEDLGVRLGVAVFPRDGRTPDQLLAAAREGAFPSEPTVDADHPIIEDPAMVDLYRVAEKVARGRISVLLLGETGVGKEILARSLHRFSPRRDRPFLGLNCGALSETLLESELFGYEKGAFTGADRTKPGLLEAADGGSVFLDEVGELPALIQVKLLRALEEGEVLRLGALRPRAVDVRFVSATNRNLEEDVRRGRFREDLFFRLSGATLDIPPLRERHAELEILARAFVQRAAKDAGEERVPAIAPDAMKLLTSYEWPGNIRELRNVMERAVLLCTAGIIEPKHLPVEKMTASWLAVPEPLGRATSGIRPPPSSVHAMTVAADVTKDAHGRDLSAREIGERARVIKALEEWGGNQTRAARTLGISRQTLVKKIAKYQLPRPRKGAED